VASRPPFTARREPVATQDRRGLYTYLTESLGPMSGVSALDVSPILATMKHTGVIRKASTTRGSWERRIG